MIYTSLTARLYRRSAEALKKSMDLLQSLMVLDSFLLVISRMIIATLIPLDIYLLFISLIDTIFLYHHSY